MSALLSASAFTFILTIEIFPKKYEKWQFSEFESIAGNGIYPRHNIKSG
jgi:hypothetical protein